VIDAERVQRIIDFIECLPVPSGKLRGQPFKLMEWEKDFIRDVYGPTGGDGLRIVRRGVLSIGRKNGKTTLIAALVLVHLVGPEAIENGEVASAATEREQAAIIFKQCSRIIKMEPELAEMLTIVPSTKTIVCYENGSTYKALSSEAGSKHGGEPSFVLYDELAQAKNRELYDVLDTSMGTHAEPLFITISTQNNDPQHVLSELIDDGLSAKDPTTVTHLHAVPDKVEDVFKEKEWYAANPALGVFRSLKDMRAMAARAKRMPSFENTFRNLYLNQRVDAKSPLIPRSEWTGCKNKKTGLVPGEDVYLSLDLSGSTDLTAMTALSVEDGDRVRLWFWKPEGLIKDHQKRDRVPYAMWVKKGIITTTPGRTVNHGFVAQQIAEAIGVYNVLGVAFDRWRIEDLRRELDAIGIESYIHGKDKEIPGALRLVPWGQGFRDMAPAVDALEASILERKLQHDGNPCLTWNVSNAVSVSDPSGNRKLDKSKTRFRIDGLVSLAMALGLKNRDSRPVEPEYEVMIL